MAKPPETSPGNVTIWSLGPVQHVRAVLASRLAERLGSALRQVLDMTRDLLFGAAEFPKTLLDLLDVRRRGFIRLECVVILFHGAIRSGMSLMAP